MMKLLAFILGLALIGTGIYFRDPPQVGALPEPEESQSESPVQRLQREQKPVFQTASFHPFSNTPVTGREEAPILRNVEAEAHWNTISNLVSCATANKDCPEESFPDTDPSSRFFALRDRMLDEMDWFLSHKTSGPQQSARMLEAAHFLLTVPDEQVQAAALKAMLEQPPTPKTCEVIRQNLADVVDADMVPNITKALSRCMDASNEQQVIDYVCDVIHHGAILASKAMAKNIGPVTTDSTRGRLETCMGKLEKSERQQSMRAVLYPSSGTI